jgi:hypothetical protein
MITLAASVKSARERVWVSWMPENDNGERNSSEFCAIEVWLPRTMSHAQLTPTSEIIAEQIAKLFPLIPLA